MSVTRSACILRKFDKPQPGCTFRVLAGFFLIVATISSAALDATRQPTQFIHHTWNRADGLPAESTWDVHQSEDGYLWIGTEGGLVRFDGIEFKVFNSRTHEAFRADDVRTVAEGPPGTIWASTYGGGLIRVRDGVPKRFDKSDGLMHDVVYSTLVARNGDVWAGTAIGACRLRNQVFDCWGVKDGLAGGRILRMAEDTQGRIWFGSIGNGISSFDGTQFESYGVNDGLESPQVFMLESDPLLNIVLGTYAGDYHRISPDGLVRLDIGEFSPDLVPLSTLRDRHDNLWIGTNGSGGLWRIQPDLQRLDNSGDELQHVFGLTEDRQGGLWAATSSGLHHYRAGPFMPWGEPEGIATGTFVVTPAANDDGVWVGTEGKGLFHVSSDGDVSQFTSDQGLPSDSVSSLHVDVDKTLWIGTFGGGVALLRDGKIDKVLDTESGLLENQITAILRDRGGAMWVGTAGGLHRLVNGEITHRFTTEDGLVANLVRHLAEDRDRNLLISSDSGLTRLSLDTFEVIDFLDRSQGLSTDVVATTHVDRGGVIWIGHRSGGLARLDGDELFVYTSEHALGIDSIMTIVEDYEGYFWLGGRRGIVRVSRSELERVAQGKSERVTSRAFSENDGLRSIRVPGGFKTASARTRDGRLWFATAKGLAVVDPRHLTPLNEPLDIIIEGVQADGVDVLSDGAYHIPAGTQSIQVDYTVPRLHDADSLRFRYRMQGDGERWLEAGRRRTAFFNSLPARANTFEVSVTRFGQPFADNAGNSATIEIFVEPLWYQTYSTRVFIAGLALLLAWIFYRVAVRRYRYRQKRLEELVDVRTEELQEALGEVQKLSRTDVLTQVANRRHFEERMVEFWDNAVKEGEPIGIMMLDIDYFKQYNDVAGHQEGDRCLKAVAQALAKHVRGRDFVARYGGEEFVVLLSGSDAKATFQIGERLQSSVRELQIPHPGRPSGSVVTVSAGFVTAEPGSIDSKEDLIKRADEALYKAKEQGRDCIVIDNVWPRTA